MKGSKARRVPLGPLQCNALSSNRSEQPQPTSKAAPKQGAKKARPAKQPTEQAVLATPAATFPQAKDENGAEAANAAPSRLTSARRVASSKPPVADTLATPACQQQRRRNSATPSAAIGSTGGTRWFHASPLTTRRPKVASRVVQGACAPAAPPQQPAEQRDEECGAQLPVVDELTAAEGQSLQQDAEAQHPPQHGNTAGEDEVVHVAVSPARMTLACKGHPGSLPDAGLPSTPPAEAQAAAKRPADATATPRATPTPTAAANWLSGDHQGDVHAASPCSDLTSSSSVGSFDLETFAPSPLLVHNPMFLTAFSPQPGATLASGTAAAMTPPPASVTATSESSRPLSSKRCAAGHSATWTASPVLRALESPVVAPEFSPLMTSSPVRSQLPPADDQAGHAVCHQQPSMGTAAWHSAAATPSIAGHGTPVDFTDVFDLREFGSRSESSRQGSAVPYGHPDLSSGLLLDASQSPATERSLQAWFDSGTPPSAASTQHAASPLPDQDTTAAQQMHLMLCTPASGPASVQATPFLRQLMRTVPELSPEPAYHAQRQAQQAQQQHDEQHAEQAASFGASNQDTHLLLACSQPEATPCGSSRAPLLHLKDVHSADVYMSSGASPPLLLNCAAADSTAASSAATPRLLLDPSAAASLPAVSHAATVTMSLGHTSPETPRLLLNKAAAANVTMTRGSAPVPLLPVLLAAMEAEAESSCGSCSPASRQLPADSAAAQHSPVAEEAVELSALADPAVDDVIDAFIDAELAPKSAQSGVYPASITAFASASPAPPSPGGIIMVASPVNMLPAVPAAAVAMVCTTSQPTILPVAAGIIEPLPCQPSFGGCAVGLATSHAHSHAAAESDAAASVASATSGPEAPGGAVDSSTPLEDADAQCQPVMGSPGPADLVLGAPLSISFDGLVLSADNFGNQESGAADPSQAQAVSSQAALRSSFELKMAALGHGEVLHAVQPTATVAANLQPPGQDADDPNPVASSAAHDMRKPQQAKAKERTPFQLMMAHLAGGDYASPGDQATLAHQFAAVCSASDSPATPIHQCSRLGPGLRGQLDAAAPVAIPALALDRLDSAHHSVSPTMGAGGSAAPLQQLEAAPQVELAACGAVEGQTVGQTEAESREEITAAATPLVSRMPTPSRRPAIAPSPVSIGKGTLESWLEKVGIDSTFNTPARQDLQRLWGAAGEAKELRRLIQTVKESELDIAKTEAAEHQRHWDLMMEHSAHVEAENAQLRSELDEVQEALQQLGISNQAALEAAEMQKGLAEAEAERAKEAARQILELAMHANEDSAAREAEKAALVQELDTARLRLQEAEAARQAAHQVVGSSQSQIAAMDEELRGARLGMLAAEAAAHSAAQQAQANASEKLQIQAELMRSQEQLATALAASAAAGAAEDAAIAGLYAELKEAHEALYELHAERTHAEELAGLELRMQAEESQKLKAEVAALGEAQAADFLADQVFQAELQRAQQARQEAELERIKAMEEAGIIERMCQHENQLLRMGLQDAKERLAAAQAKAATADSEVQTAGLTPCKPCPCPSPAQQAARQTDRPAQVDSETAMTPVKAAAEPALVDSETTMTPVRATAERVSLAECQTSPLVAATTVCADTQTNPVPAAKLGSHAREADKENTAANGPVQQPQRAQQGRVASMVHSFSLAAAAPASDSAKPLPVFFGSHRFFPAAKPATAATEPAKPVSKPSMVLPINTQAATGPAKSSTKPTIALPAKTEAAAAVEASTQKALIAATGDERAICRTPGSAKGMKSAEWTGVTARLRKLRAELQEAQRKLDGVNAARTPARRAQGPPPMPADPAAVQLLASPETATQDQSWMSPSAAADDQPFAGTNKSVGQAAAPSAILPAVEPHEEASGVASCTPPGSSQHSADQPRRRLEQPHSALGQASPEQDSLTRARGVVAALALCMAEVPMATLPAVQKHAAEVPGSPAAASEPTPAGGMPEASIQSVPSSSSSDAAGSAALAVAQAWPPADCGACSVPVLPAREGCDAARAGKQYAAAARSEAVASLTAAGFTAASPLEEHVGSPGGSSGAGADSMIPCSPISNGMPAAGDVDADLSTPVADRSKPVFAACGSDTLSNVGNSGATMPAMDTALHSSAAVSNAVFPEPADTNTSAAVAAMPPAGSLVEQQNDAGAPEQALWPDAVVTTPTASRTVHWLSPVAGKSPAGAEPSMDAAQGGSMAASTDRAMTAGMFVSTACVTPAAANGSAEMRSGTPAASPRVMAAAPTVSSSCGSIHIAACASSLDHGSATPEMPRRKRVTLGMLCAREDDSDDSEPESADRMPMRMRRVGGRAPSEVEEREFRRRAAALRIRISPYFKRR